LGVTQYLGIWADPQAAFIWLAKTDDLLAGWAPRTDSAGLSVHELMEEFLANWETLSKMGNELYIVFIESTIANEHSTAGKVAKLGWNSHVLR
jgi:hypothetical protein